MRASQSLWPFAVAACVALACSSGSSSDNDDGAAGGGSGGSGGRGSAGNANAGGEPGAPEGGAAGGSSGQCGCLDQTLSWGRVGGRVASHDTSTLAPCAIFSHERGPLDGEALLSCTQGLAETCGDELGSDDVVTALAHADVAAALAAAPVLYGSDPRTFDGQVLQITIGDLVIEVGDACEAADCTDIPQGVSALADTLLALGDQELDREPCSAVFSE
jgi:hypothetical protein